MATPQNLGDNDGRFGNQLFKLAAAYAHSRRMNEPCYVKEWNKAKYFPNLTEMVKLGYQQRNSRVFKEPHFYYTPIPLEPALCLEGFFQGEQYFEGHENDIRQLFSPHEPVRLNEGTCLHVRGADFLLNPPAYTRLGLDYYQRGVDHHGCKKVDVFTDDIRYATKLLSGLSVPFEIKSRPQTPIINDFMAMRGYSSIITSQSTFCWWAAWLSECREAGHWVFPLRAFEHKSLIRNTLTPSSAILL